MNPLWPLMLAMIIMVSSISEYMDIIKLLIPFTVFYPGGGKVQTVLFFRICILQI